MGKTGTLEVICGCMYSGKTEELIRRIRRELIAKRRIQVFKSYRDIRYSINEIASHDGQKVKALLVPKSEGKETTSSEELFKIMDLSNDVFAIDEVQFFDVEMAHLCNKLANSGKRIIVAGLDLDFRGMPFRGPMPLLMSYADKIDKLQAVCSICGSPASHTQRLINGRPAKWDETIYLIGGEDTYKAVCRKHHIIKRPNSGKLIKDYKVEMKKQEL